MLGGARSVGSREITGREDAIGRVSERLDGDDADNDHHLIISH